MLTMKKYANIRTGSILLSMFLLSCINDKGSYVYEDVDAMYPAKIASGIDASYEVMAGDTLFINPVFENGASVDESNYEYLWFSMKKDTLGHDRELAYPVHLKAGAHTLFFRITDRQRGTMSYYQTSLKVVTEFSQGWFLTKETGNGTTEIDFIEPGGRLLPDLINMANREEMPGKPVKTTFAYVGYGVFNDATNRIEGRPTFIVASESDIWSFSGIDMAVHFRTNDMFINAPGVIKPYDVGTYNGGSLNATILVNDGDFHWVTCGFYVNTPANDGRYTENLFPSIDMNKHVCKIFAYPLHILTPGMLLFFDNNTASFGKVEANMLVTAVTLANFSGASSVAGIPNCNNMPYELIYMKEYSMVQGLGIMRSTADGQYYGFKTVNVAPSNIANPFDAFVPVPAGANVATAAIRCVNKTNATIYSSSGDNRVFAYKVGGQGDASGTETQILTLGANENVTCIEDVRYSAIEGNSSTFKHLVVVTSSGTDWNMYCYDFIGSSDNIYPVPVKQYSGSGKVVHVLYRGLANDPCL
jgi:hypothetical protein